MGIFRKLRADEIDCRIGSINEKGLTLLLYKDARCDMNILDETFGPFGWQRHHSRDNANCTVSIFDSVKMDWIEKEDTGTESNTEAEKGLASDSFKRACFNWGIGRELYTAPYIWISAANCEIKLIKCRDGKERYVCNDKFRVVEISYDDKTGGINRLTIANDSKGVDVFTYPRSYTMKAVEVKAPKEAPDGYYYCEKCGEVIKEIKLKDGTVLTQHEAAARSIGKYGRQLCLTCAKNEKPTA